MTHHWGYVAAALSAVFYGASYPLNKLLLAGLPPMLLAGLAYLASGTYLALLRLSPRQLVAPLYGALGLEYRRPHAPTAEALALAFVVAILGSFLAPYVFLEGLRSVPASDASLLAVSELAFTLVMVAALLGERFGREELLGVAAIAAGLAVMAVGSGGDGRGNLTGYALVLLGCLLWAADNSVSKLLAIRGDVIEVASLKSLAGSALLLSVSAATGQLSGLDPRYLSAAAAVGVLCLGNSLLLFFAGLRHVGSGRTTSIFASNSLFGALWTCLLLRESPGGPQLVAAALISAGIAALYRAGGRAARLRS